MAINDFEDCWQDPETLYVLCMVIFTRRGLAATQAAVLRPERAPIFAFSNDPVVVRQLALARDVTATNPPSEKTRPA